MIDKETRQRATNLKAEQFEEEINHLVFGFVKDSKALHITPTKKRFLDLVSAVIKDDMFK